MAIGSTLEINVDLFEALTDVLGTAPAEPTPVNVLASYLYGLAKGYGLSDSPHLTESQLERADLPEQATALVTHVIANGAASIDGESLRDSLYDVLVHLSRDPRARRVLNKNEALSEVGLLKVAQIFWNLEATDTRPLLPIRSGQKYLKAGAEVRADIKVPEANKDFATMKWTERTTTGATGLGAGQAYKSSGQGFRRQGARLAVLAAELIVNRSTQPLPVVDTAELWLGVTGGGSRTATISWSEPGVRDTMPKGLAEQIAAVTDRVSRADVGRVMVGRPPEVGNGYQRRSFDDRIDKLWTDGGDRRVWLRGGPGVGKSYSARRVMEDAIADHSEDCEELLIWVDSADAVSVSAALSLAVDRMPRLGIGAGAEAQDRVHRQARALLDELATSHWRWLIILDNADAGSLLDSGLIPPGRNPNGRVLVTTLSADTRIEGCGGVITAGLFAPEEADEYLSASLASTDGEKSALMATASPTNMRALARAVGYHPLALSVAAATITSNRMDVVDWLKEFATAERLEIVADARDPGGYPHGIGAIWRIALEKASQGLPDGLAVRAACVAAVMDPDGHPTWLWDRPSVARWIAGNDDTLSLHHGRPVAVERLIDHSLIESKGGSWREGLLTMHQLAARAVREFIDEASLGEIAGILLDELAGDDAPDDRYFAPVDTVIGSLTQLLKIPRVAATKRVCGLLFEGELRFQMFEFPEALTAYLNAYEVALSVADDEDGTAQGRQFLALTHLGTMHSLLGHEDELLIARQRALAIAHSLAESANDEARRGGNIAVGSVLRDLGRSEEAATYLSRALELQPAEPDGEDEDRLTWLFQRGGIQVWLGREIEAERNLTHALEILDRLEWSRRESTAARIASTLKPIQVGLGHLREAERTQSRLVDALGRLAKGGRLTTLGAHAEALTELADMIKDDPRGQLRATALYTRAADAAAAFTGVSPGRVEHTMQIDTLMAQGRNHAHNGRHAEAAGTFGEAAKIAQIFLDLSADDSMGSRAMRVRYAAALLQLGVSQALCLADTHPSERELHAVQGSLGLAVEEYARLTEEDPAEHDTEYLHALALVRLGNMQHLSGQQEEALASLMRAVPILSLLADLALDAPEDSGVLHTLVLSIVELGDIQSESGKETEAVETYLRLLVLVDRVPDETKGFLAVGLFRCADLLERVGLSQQAAHVRGVGVSIIQDRDIEE